MPGGRTPVRVTLGARWKATQVYLIFGDKVDGQAETRKEEVGAGLYLIISVALLFIIFNPTLLAKHGWSARRLALSSILHRRYEAMRAVPQTPDLSLTLATAQQAMRLGDNQARTWLADLVDVGLLQKDGEGRWVPAPPFATILRGDGPE
jgi:hypothetical protein